MCHHALVLEPHHPSALIAVGCDICAGVPQEFDPGECQGFVGLFISPKDLNQSRHPFAVLFPQAAGKAATCRNSNLPRSVHVK